MLNKLIRRFHSRQNINFNTLSKFRFCYKTNNIIDNLDIQITNIEKVYSSPNPTDVKNFLDENRWVLFQNENSSKLILKKSKDEFDLTVTFSAKSPVVLADENNPQGI